MKSLKFFKLKMKLAIRKLNFIMVLAFAGIFCLSFVLSFKLDTEQLLYLLSASITFVIELYFLNKLWKS